MNVEDHFFSDKGQPNEDFSSVEEQSGVDDSKLGRSEDGPDSGMGRIPNTPRLDMRVNYTDADFSRGYENRARLSGGGGKIIDRLLEVTGLNNLPAKIGMKYEQFWLDEREKKINELKTEVKKIDTQIGVTKKIADTVKPGANTGLGLLKLKTLGVAERKINKLEGEKKELLAKIETHEASAREYARRRDVVAGQLIASCDEKIVPLEAEKERLKAGLERFDQENEPMERLFAGWEAEIADLEAQRTESINELAASGMTEKEIAGEVSYFNSLIKGIRNELNERDNLRRRRAAMEKKIAKVNEKLVKMDNKRKEYVDAKDSKASIRHNSVVAEAQTASAPDRGPVEETAEVDDAEAAGESNAENKAETFKAGEALADWNAYISEKVDKGFTMKPVIGAGEFFQKSQLQEGEIIRLDAIKKSIRDFYDAKYPTGWVLKYNISQVLESWTGKNEITGDDVVKNKRDLKHDAGNEEEKSKNQMNNERKEAKGKVFATKDLVEAWSMFARKNAVANKYLDLTLNLPDLAKENEDLGINATVEKFRRAVFNFFVTNSLRGAADKKVVERSLEAFGKQAAQFVDVAKQEAEIKHETDEFTTEAENSGEGEKSDIIELGREWLEFAKERYKNQSYMKAVFDFDKLKRADHTPDDGMVNADQFKKILLQFYQKEFELGKNEKRELEKAIDEFIKKTKNFA